MRARQEVGRTAGSVGSSSSASGRLAPSDQTVALELAVQGRSPDLELLGRVGLVSVVQRQRRDDVVLFDGPEWTHGAVGVWYGKRVANLVGQVLEFPPAPARGCDGALHRFLEDLPD